MTTIPCRACAGTWPQTDHFIAEAGLTRAYLHDDQFFRGWTVLVLKRHATELFHLSQGERTGLMEEVARAAETLARELGAIKINYELLGNQLPHIHWHLIPRLAQDPAPLEPVWRVVHEPVSLPSDQLAALCGRLRRVWPPS